MGKTRYENLGIIVFASVMGTASLQIITESLRALTEPTPPLVHLTTPTLAVLITVIGTKLTLFLWCYHFRKQSSSCAALAQDHFNDVMTNSLTLTFVLVGR